MKMDRERFLSLCSEYGNLHADNGIGTLDESSLHAVLKYYFEPDESRHEKKIGRYVADIVGENGIVEIQTKAMFRMRDKLSAFLDYSHVTVVYPVIQKKYVVRLDENGTPGKRRLSPVRESIHQVFGELYGIRDLVASSRLTLCVVCLEVEDRRLPAKPGKRRGTRIDRVPTDILDEFIIESPDDYRRFLPADTGETFTSSTYSELCHISRSTAQTELLILTGLGVVERIGKQGREILYRQARG